MKHIIIAVILTTLFFVLLASPQISFKPFSISFKSLWEAIGYFLCMAGVIIISVTVSSKSYKEGLEKGSEIYKEVLLQKLQEEIHKTEEDKKESK